MKVVFNKRKELNNELIFDQHEREYGMQIDRGDRQVTEILSTLRAKNENLKNLQGI